MKKEILYGIHPVLEALKTKRRAFFSIYIPNDRPSKRMSRIVSLAESQAIPIVNVESSRLKSMAGTDQHQGIVAKVGSYPLTGLSEIIDKPISATTDPFLLLLDNIEDPRNFGALIRTALSVDINGIIIPKHRSAQPTPVVSKASAGALEHVSLAKVTNMTTTINRLKENGLWIIGLDQTADQSVFSYTFPDSIAIVIGGEHKGIRPLVKKQCDVLISIPQIGPVDSLNAAVAGALAMYEVFRQRFYPQ